MDLLRRPLDSGSSNPFESDAPFVALFSFVNNFDIQSHPELTLTFRRDLSRSLLNKGFFDELRLAGADDGAYDDGGGGYSKAERSAAVGEGGAVESGEDGLESGGVEIVLTK